MKKLTIILSLFVLTIFINAQDSTSYTQFKYDVMNVEISTYGKIRINVLQWKPTLILLSTFIINEVIITYDKGQYTSLKTSAIFLTGITACVFILIKSYE